MTALDYGKKAKAAKMDFISLTQGKKNQILEGIATELLKNSDYILSENKKDIAKAKENKMPSAMVDRLTLTPERIQGIAHGTLQVKSLKDPVGEVIGGGTLENGLSMTKVRVPLGVVGIIFESRPNVTVDAAVLCIKSSNVCILRGGSDAINSNKALIKIIRQTLDNLGVNPDGVQLVEDTSRETATQLMRLNQYIDVLIPRGGAGLINAVVQNATIPVIQTGEGNCHLFIDETGDIDSAVKIADNSKTQRPSVCNSIETLLVHEKIAKEFLPLIAEVWNKKVAIYGDEQTSKYIEVARIATEQDYSTEFNDYEIAVKIVKNIDEAIAHINKFGTEHSEGIITSSIENSNKFQLQVDAAAVYVNASTRFTDGYELGLGAEIGISTQKLHARGPMGLTELTTCKYLINGNGTIRE